MERRGIVLAGGAGTRLSPLTRVLSKQLLPVYDKPMVYYPLSVLMLAGIREVLVISTPRDLPQYQALLGDGSHLGCRFSFLPQPRPEGLSQAFLIGEEFLGDAPAALVLGDNVFYGHGMVEGIRRASGDPEAATVFAYRVQDPERYGVVDFDAEGRARHLEEKPADPRSHWAVTGLYFYPPGVAGEARQLTPSARGELEITDLNRRYLDRGRLRVERLGRGIAWLDTGTHESLLQASVFIETLESRQGLKVACLEEIAWRMGFIDPAAFRELASGAPPSGYGDYLRGLVREELDGA